MSFLAGRLAATEGSYFLQESKQAVTHLAQKKPNNLSSSPSPSSMTEPQPDVLHEILRHSLPTKIFEPPSDSSLSTGSKWVLPHDPTKVSSISFDAQNPHRAYVSLPHVSFGPKRWQLPEGEHLFSAAMANDLHRDKYTHVNPEKLKAAAERAFTRLMTLKPKEKTWFSLSLRCSGSNLALCESGRKAHRKNGILKRMQRSKSLPSLRSSPNN